MANHVKPTPEELKAQEEAAIAEAEKIEAEGIPQEEEETQEESAEAAETDSPPQDASAEDETQEEVVEEPEKEEQADPSKELFKKKFKESSKENQKIYAKNRLINKALVEAEDVEDPTEDDLNTLYPDYDLASDIEKTLIKETEITKRFRQTIAKAKDQATKIEKWNDGVDEYVTDPKTLIDNPGLEGKTEEFSDYAKKEEHNSVPFNILTSAFLFDQSKGKPVNKGRMFERGTGGPNDKPVVKTDKITLEQARSLRESDYSKYREYLMAGKIENNI